MKIKKTRGEYALKVDVAEMRLIVSALSAFLIFGRCKNCIYEDVCDMRKAEKKQDFCTEIAELKERFFGPLG